MLQFHLLKCVYHWREKKGRMEEKNVFSSVYLSSLYCIQTSLFLLLPCGWIMTPDFSLDDNFSYNSLFRLLLIFSPTKHPSDDFHYSASKQSPLEPNMNTAGDGFSVLSPGLADSSTQNRAALMPQPRQSGSLCRPSAAPRLSLLPQRSAFPPSSQLSCGFLC